MVMQIFVEGGGPTSATQSACRASFTKYISRIVPRSTRRPRVIACGGRQQAYNDFRRALRKPERDCLYVLLVDSEELVDLRHRANPWDHLAHRVGDGWEQPGGVTPEQAQLMVACVESWIASDPEALAAYYGKDFRRNALPTATDLETVEKLDIYESLDRATRDTKKRGYGKGHAFDLVGLINPALVEARCLHFAKRFNDFIRARCG